MTSPSNEQTRSVVRSAYRAPGWGRNAHVQTIAPTLPPWRSRARRRAAPLLAKSDEWLLDCGDGVRLQAWHSAVTRNSGRTAMLLHGWEGSADSSYVLSLAADLYSAGYDVVRLNLRDHGDTQGLNRELFHSCRLPEVVGAVRAVAALCSDQRLLLAGFSLGGNFMLRVAAASGLPANVAGVVGISPVLHPARALQALETGSVFYHRYFVAKWLRSLRRKQQLWPEDFDFRHLYARPRLRDMTAALVREHTPFASMDDYLDGYAITGQRLATLAVPAHLLASADDPIIPCTDLAHLSPTPQLVVERSDHGGHCGFLLPGRGGGYANRCVLERFATWSRSAS